MSVKLHLLEATGRLTPFKEKIESAFHKSVEEASAKIPLGELDVVIWDSPRGVIPEIGIGGRTNNPHTIFVPINPEHSDLGDTIEMNLEKTLVHEFHHCARQSTMGYPRTLFKALVSEGLADHFQIEITGGKPPLWSTALTDNELQQMLALAKAEYDNEKYNRDGWFFGDKEKGIPRWAGYSLGFRIVSDYLKSNPQESAATLVGKEADDFVKDHE